jgi:hypothetical protein
VRKSKQAGITVTDTIGDAAYSEKDTIYFAQENDFHLVSKD